MSAERPFQPAAAPAEQTKGNLHITPESVQSPYFTAEEAAAYLRFGTPAAFREWLRHNPLPRCRRGKRLLFDRRVLDAYVRGDLRLTKGVHRRGEARPKQPVSRRLEVVPKHGDSLAASAEGK